MRNVLFQAILGLQPFEATQMLNIDLLSSILIDP